MQVRITASWAVANLCDALCSIVEADDSKKASKLTITNEIIEGTIVLILLVSWFVEKLFCNS